MISREIEFQENLKYYNVLSKEKHFYIVLEQPFFYKATLQFHDELIWPHRKSFFLEAFHLILH